MKTSHPNNMHVPNPSRKIYSQRETCVSPVRKEKEKLLYFPRNLITLLLTEISVYISPSCFVWGSEVGWRVKTQMMISSFRGKEIHLLNPISCWQVAQEKRCQSRLFVFRAVTITSQEMTAIHSSPALVIYNQSPFASYGYKDFYSLLK